MLKVATIVGARPQFIKAAVVSRAIGGHYKKIPWIPRESTIELFIPVNTMIGT